jgi:hypothetical protein
MLNHSEKAYCLALQALKNKKYRSAADLFDRAEPFFRDNAEFCLLRETNRLLLFVKQQKAIGSKEMQIVIEESFSNG